MLPVEVRTEGCVNGQGAEKNKNLPKVIGLSGWLWLEGALVRREQGQSRLESGLMKDIRAASEAIIKDNGSDLRLKISDNSETDYVRYVVDDNYLYYTKQEGIEWPINWTLDRRITDVVVNNFKCGKQEEYNKILITINLSLGTAKEKYILQNQVYLRN